MGAPVAARSFMAPPTWSMWAWVMTICFTCRLCLRTRARMFWISSPGSITMAFRVLSSPMIEQLQCNGPTGRISWIIVCVVRFLSFGQTISDYFCGVGVAGFTGCDLAGEALTPCCTELVPLWREAATESVIEVTIKMMADQVVALERIVAVPRGPKAVWLPMPPKAAAISP